MKIVFEGKDKKVDAKKDGKFKLLPVPDEIYDRASTGSVSAGLSVGNLSKSYVGGVVPEPPLEVPKPPTPVRPDIEAFKNEFMGVFGIESIIPSNKDVLVLNLLFSIYGELRKLNDKFTEE
jgi:hypothetical protein